MLNKAQLKKDQKALKQPKKLKKPKDVIIDPRGQWAHPGEITQIPSGDISMIDVPYPVFGIDNLGNRQMMYPDRNYKFPGKNVIEYPLIPPSEVPNDDFFSPGRMSPDEVLAKMGGTPRRGQIYDRLGRLHSIKSYVPFAKNGGSNTNNMSKDFKGRKYPFPQIQSEAEFFSPGYHNINSPYDHGSFQFGGSNPFNTQPTDDEFFSFGPGASSYMMYRGGGGFGEGHPFPTQPTMKEISSYGRPNWPYFIAEMGGVPCYNCGGNYKRHFGGDHASDNNVYKSTMEAMGPADINQGPQYFTNKMNNFTKSLRDSATKATLEKMADMAPPGYHVMPDGSIMNDALMQYFMGGGLDRSEDYGSKKKPYPSVKSSDFAGTNRSYPIPTRADAVDALRLAGLHGRADIKAKVYSKYPELRPKAKHGGDPTMGPYHNLSQEDYDTIYSQMYMKDGGNWIAGAINPAHKGYCTPMSKKTCTPRRKAFARRAKAHFKQEGGDMQEAKWQAILVLAEQGITDPVEIASRLNQEGTFPTTPEEVQGYLEQQMSGGDDYMQEGGQSMNPFAMSNINMYAGANQQAQEDADIVGGVNNFLGNTANMFQQGGPTQQEFQSWLDQYFTANPDRRPQTSVNPQYQVAPGYGQPYGYAPANSLPYMKVKNKNYFYGPQGRGTSGSSPFVSGSSAGFPTEFTSPGGRGSIDINYGRGFFGLGPNRLRSINYKWGTGNEPVAPAKKTSSIGDKFREVSSNLNKYGVAFPSKTKREEFAAEEARRTSTPGSMSSTFTPPPSSGITDPNIISQLNAIQTGVATPQTGPAPESQVPSKSMEQLNEEYRQAVAERDKVFEEHKLNKRGKRRNILGIKYGKGGPYGYNYMQAGGNPFSTGAFDEGTQQWDPSMTTYFDTTAEGDQVSKDEQFNPSDKLFDYSQFAQDEPMGGEGKIKFGNRMAGEDAANWGIVGLNLGANIFSQDERRNAESKLKKQFKAENIFSPAQERDRGDYTTNYGYFRPDQQSVGRMVTGRNGGQYQEGGEYEMTEEEIQMLRGGGYTIEYI